MHLIRTNAICGQLIPFGAMGTRPFGPLHFYMFHSSSVFMQSPNHRLYPKVDWSRIDAGHYAVVDPIDSHAILYLTERAYQVQVRVSLSQDSALVVLARPGERPISPSGETPSPAPCVRNPSDDDDDPSKNSPLPSAKAFSSQVWRRFLRWHLSSLVHLTGAKRKGSKDSVSVAISVEVLRLLLPYWGLDLHYRLGGHLHPPRSLVRALRTMAEAMVSIFQHQGPQALIVRMKGTMFLLNRYLAGNKDNNPWLLGTPVGLCRSGIPRIIPVYFRRGIVSGDNRTIRIVLSILNAYKVLEGTHKEEDLANVLGEIPSQDPATLKAFEDFCKEVFWPKVVKSYVPSREWHDVSHPNFAIGLKSPVYIPTRAGPNAPFGLFGASLDAWAWHLEPINWPLVWCEHVGDTRTPDLFRKTISALGGPSKGAWAVNDSFIGPGFNGVTPLVGVGKLEFLPEPAGKVRTIAIVDYWTQRLMSPVHDWMMKVLKYLPTDGTFDQERSLRSFASRISITGEPCASIDLKSATDLIPITLYRACFNGILPEETVSLWISFLTDRPFRVPNSKLVKRELRGTDIRYGRGQPMGTLSSWPSMALVHHALELFSAYRVGLDPSLFVDYRVLGDDNVTGNALVSQEYLKVTSLLSVPTSLAKTIFGNLFIFASQIYRGTDNLSPLSLKEELGIRSYSQRLELSLRAVARGWLGESVTLPRFLRLLLSRRDFKSQVKCWCRGELGKITQSALVSAFGIGTRRLLDLLGFQGSGFTPFLEAIASKVQAISRRPGLDEGNQIPTSHEIGFAIATAETLIRELNRLIGKLQVASIRYRMWNDAIEESGFLPRDFILDKLVHGKGGKAPERPGIAAVPSKWKTGADIASQFKYIPYKVGGSKTMQYTDIFTPLQSQLDRAMWPTIQDSYASLFGTATIDPSVSDYTYLEAEDSGTGITLTSSNDKVSVGGRAYTVPGIVEQTRKARRRAEEIMSTLVKGAWNTNVSPLTELEGLAEVIKHISRVPDFTGFGGFYALVKREEDLLSPWVRRAKLLEKVVRLVPLAGAGGSLTPGQVTELPGGPLSREEAISGLQDPVAPEGFQVGHKTNQGLLTGFTNSIVH